MNRILIMGELFVSVFVSTPTLTISHSLFHLQSLPMFFILFITVLLFTFSLLSQRSLSQPLFGSLIYSSTHSLIQQAVPPLPILLTPSPLSPDSYAV